MKKSSLLMKMSFIDGKKVEKKKFWIKEVE